MTEQEGSREVCVMQSAGTVLAVLRERGSKGLPCGELYRQLFNKDLYLLAYGNIYPNKGAMTPGADGRTADGMSGAEIDRIIGLMRAERYRFAPVRRVYIPKKNGKLRPLGLPSWAGKLVGEVVRLLLEAIYEPSFSARSHGFRKGRGCHTALREVASTWTGTVWFIEGDISDCSAYNRLDRQIASARRRGDRAAARHLARQRRAVPRGDPLDPGYRRLFYVRYADDHLLGFIGPKAEAEEIKAKLAAFLRETLALELNPAKTLVTHARSGAARFLGYDVTVQHCDTKLTGGCRSANGKIALRVPLEVITAKCAPYRCHGTPWHRPQLQNLPDYDIVRIYGAEYRGIVNYYLLAQNVGWLSALRWHAETSMLKTLAAKHKSTVATMAARYRAKIQTGGGRRTCCEARKQRQGKQDLVARFGGIPLRCDRRAVITDPALVPVKIPYKELIHRLGQRACELCDHGAAVAVHHVAKLADLGKPGPDQPAWAALMAKMRRKTLVVCAQCHDHIHATPVAHAA